MPQLPAFTQIESSAEPQDFLSGFEKFTRVIEEYIETRDEQYMQNIVRERKKTTAF